MKKLVIAAALLLGSSAFALQVGEAFDFNSGYQPAGASLGNVCYEQGKLKTTVKQETCETTWVVDADDRGEVFPHQWELTNEEYMAQGSMGAIYTPEKMCTSTGMVTKTIPMKRVGCKTYKEYVVNHGEGDGDRVFTKCVETELVDLPRSQRLDVYLVQIGQNLTSGQNMGSEMYTIPDCEAPKGDLPEKDLPETKK